jgi:hypothetical protein
MTVAIATPVLLLWLPVVGCLVGVARPCCSSWSGSRHPSPGRSGWSGRGVPWSRSVWGEPAGTLAEWLGRSPGSSPPCSRCCSASGCSAGPATSKGWNRGTSSGRSPDRPRWSRPPTGRSPSRWRARSTVVGEPTCRRGRTRGTRSAPASPCSSTRPTLGGCGCWRSRSTRPAGRRPVSVRCCSGSSWARGSSAGAGCCRRCGWGRTRPSRSWSSRTSTTTSWSSRATRIPRPRSRWRGWGWRRCCRPRRRGSRSSTTGSATTPRTGTCRPAGPPVSARSIRSCARRSPRSGVGRRRSPGGSNRCRRCSSVTRHPAGGRSSCSRTGSSCRRPRSARWPRRSR